jgi:hypothetical protein
MRSPLVPAALLLALAACHSPGPYGHAPQYAPLDDEKSAVADAREYDPVMYQRLPDEWRKGTVSLFGVVTNRGSGPGGGAYLALSVRRLEPRNLCDSMHDDDTCRVTVSDADWGVVHVLVPLTGADDVGEHSVGVGSLVRVVGQITEAVDPNDGTPIVRARWYRHWPRYFWVPKSAARELRQ